MVENQSGDSANKSNNQEEYLITMFDEYLAKARTLAETCEADGMKATDRKRLSRWLTSIFGVLTATGGALILLLPPNSNIYKYLGIGSTISGAIIATVGQYLDPEKTRGRAVSLKNLKIDIDSLVDKKEVDSLDFKNKKLDEEGLKITYKDLVNEFAELEKKATDLGVGI